MAYGLGLESPPSNNKASKGNCVHRALELLARKKLAMQEGRSTFLDEETGTELWTDSITVQHAIDLGYRLYYEREKYNYKWTDRDYDDVCEWTHQALAYNDGYFNPLNRHVIFPEKFFEFELPHDWAAYRYELSDGTILEGQLKIRGTIDLVVAVDGYPGLVEMIDWKTGRRLDWATGEEKDWKKLRRDKQLLLYHYALRKLLPEISGVVVTIVFIRDGGPFSLDFGPDDMLAAEEMLREKFEAIKRDGPPRLNKSWKCTKFCHFGRNNWGDSGKTVCEFMREEAIQLGTTKLWEKYADVDAVRSYTGGGRSAREKTA